MTDTYRRAGHGLRKGAFIDRDGVINEERGFVHQAQDFALLAGALDALRSLQRAGYAVVVITNQSGIARGLYSEDDYLQLSAHLREVAFAAGVRLDAIEYCPHLPDAPVPRYRSDCDCRKPRPGMITRAAAALDIDLAGSVLIGDRSSDVAAGRAAGVGRCYLVRSGCDLTVEAIASADGVFDGIGECVRHILAPQPPS